jgi:AcrR family transcriptional regulator
MSSVSRKRDPEATRECILAAAREVLAQDGKEGLSVTQVARRAGVNRGTAYGFFPTREHLIEAVGAFWVSDELCRAVFGLNPQSGRASVEQVTERLVRFAMDNPELGRIWLFELLSSQQPANDRFWRQYLSHLQEFAKTDLAQPGLDAEVQSVLILAATFLWPLWTHPRAPTDARQEMAERFVREILRNALHGNLRREKCPDLDARVSKAIKRR